MAESTDRLAEAGGARRLPTPVLLAWLLLCAMMAAVALTPEGRFRFLDNDSVMRLVQVRDLLGGQAWFDPVQHRLGPEGVAMHWSRLVDAPIAVLIALSSPLLTPEAAEQAAMAAWPLLLGLLFLWAVASGCRALGGRSAEWVGLVLALGLALQSLKFAPGALDHHNLQMVLLAVALAGLLARERGTWPLALAGLALAASLAVGVETAPQVVAASAAVAGLWVAEGEATRRRTAVFAASLGGGSLAAFLAATAPENRFWSSCDVLTIQLLVPALIGAAGLGAASLFFSKATPRHRLLLLGGVAGATAVAARAFPGGCLQNPLDGLDPLLREHWLDLVAETKGAAEILASGWDQYLGVYVVPLLALAAALSMAARGRPTGSALALAGLIAVSYAATVYQIRGMYILGLVSIPPLAAAIGGLYARYREGSARHGLGAVLLLAVCLPPLWGVVPVVRASLAKDAEPLQAAAPKPAAPPATTVPADCTSPALYAGLAGLPPGLVAASSNLGAHILRSTPHRVLAAPYHRNQAGMLAQLRIAMRLPDEAERELRALGVTYLAVCTADREYDWLRMERPESLFARLAQGDPPNYLEPVPSPDAALRIYRLRGEGT